MLKSLFGGINAGILIGIGGTIYLACDNNYIGALLFAVALLSICILQFYLFTGKVGFLAESFSWQSSHNLLAGLAGNFIGATTMGYLIAFVRPGLAQKAADICMNKLSNSISVNFILGLFCGILMYVAVKTYQKEKTVIGILFCIPVFILSGFEHSIANMFYFAAANMLSVKYLIFIITVIIGNTVGGMLIPWIARLGNLKKRGSNT